MSLCYTVAGRSLLLYFKTVPFALFLSSGKSLVIMLLNLLPSIFSFWDCPCFHMILWVVFPSFPGHMSVHLRPSLIQEALILKLLTSIANTLSLIKVTFPDSGGTCLFEHYHSTNSDDPIWLFFCFFFFFLTPGNYIDIMNYTLVCSEYLMLLKYIFDSSQKENYSVPSAVQGVDELTAFHSRSWNSK